MDNARYLGDKLGKIKNLKVVSNAEHIPVVTFKQKSKDTYDLFDLSSAIRSYGWIVPAYALPADASETVLMRVVVRESFSRDMADLFLDSLKKAMDSLSGRHTRKTGISPRKGHPVS
jgi:glutamate decarboxylase